MNKRLAIAIAAIAVLGAAAFLTLKPSPPTQVEESEHGIEPQKYEAINGIYVEEIVSTLRPLAVMVENHPDARPQSGLSEADIVYETLAEGGITRFLVLFQSRAANEIGSVRSARDYFAEIANEWGALYAHVGGSNEVIANLKKGIYENLDDAN